MLWAAARARRCDRRAGRALAPRAPAAGELVHAADAPLQHSLLSRRIRVRRAGRPLRRARLPPQHPLPQLAAERPGDRGPQRRLRRGQRLGQLHPLHLHQRLRRPARLARRAERLRRLHEVAHHARVHPRRSPRHDAQHLSARHQHGPRPDLRPQPGAADLVHRGDGGPHGVAPDDRRPPAQQLLRHASAGRLSRRPDVPLRSDLVDPQRLSAGDGRLPLRLEPAPLHRGPLRPPQDPGDLPPLRRHLHPGRHQSNRGEGGRQRLRRNLRPRPLGRLAARASPTATRCRPRTPSCGRSPPRRASPGRRPRRAARAPARGSCRTARWSFTAPTTISRRPTSASNPTTGAQRRRSPRCWAEGRRPPPPTVWP